MLLAGLLRAGQQLCAECVVPTHVQRRTPLLGRRQVRVGARLRGRARQGVGVRSLTGTRAQPRQLRRRTSTNANANVLFSDIRARCSGVKPVCAQGSAEEAARQRLTPRARLLVHRVQLHLEGACPHQGGAAGLLQTGSSAAQWCKSVRPPPSRLWASALSRPNKRLHSAKSPLRAAAWNVSAVDMGRAERRQTCCFCAVHFSHSRSASQGLLRKPPRARARRQASRCPPWARRCGIRAQQAAMSEHTEPPTVVELAGVTVAKPAAAAAGEYTCDEARALPAHSRLQAPWRGEDWVNPSRAVSWPLFPSVVCPFPCLSDDSLPAPLPTTSTCSPFPSWLPSWGLRWTARRRTRAAG